MMSSGDDQRRGFTVWFTGLSGSGKTTLSMALERALRERGVQFVQRLDGDVVRRDLTRDLGFSKEDRNENIRRVSFVAALLSRNGVATLCAFISPYRKARREARARHEEGSFIEVYLKCPLDVLIQRDPKGLYKKALSGEIKNFTGIDDPYEEPEEPEITLETDKMSVEECVRVIMRYLDERGFLPRSV
ncbi:TPA: adenylyl-sulfate kinase [Candidatus Poribacteria bacterium]|nr:adenylyl-sulfate kinase [Candidatus Poribacteria bacterium]